MVCKLCEIHPAIKNSHILPEFFYLPVYDPKHRFYQISTDPLKRETIHQKGIKEELLCIKCENLFSKWEGYAKKVIFGGAGSVAVTPSFLRFKDIDYTKFRLFLHSLIWRMSISNHPWFKDVDLGKNEMAYRTFFMNLDPGPEHQFWVGMTRVLINGKDANLFLPPQKIKLDGYTYYRTLISGILFHFSASKGNKGLPCYSVTRTGELIVPVQEASQIEYLKEILLDINKAFDKRPKELRKLPFASR